MTRDRLERLVALAILCFSLGYFLLAFQIRVPPSSDDSPLSARSFPFALGAVGMALSLMLMLRPPPAGDVGWSGFAWGRGIALVVLMGLYAASIQHLGFVVTSSVFLAAGFYVLGERRFKVLIPVAVITAVTFFVAFRLLDVHLDWGVFGRMFAR